jgi:hypothetical protein
MRKIIVTIRDKSLAPFSQSPYLELKKVCAGRSNTAGRIDKLPAVLLCSHYLCQERFSRKSWLCFLDIENDVKWIDRRPSNLLKILGIA